MPLPTLPTPPSRDDPANFSPRADAFLAALPAFGEAANSLEQSLQMVATTGTSTTSIAIGTGSKTLTTQAGKAWVVGAFVYIASSASVANLMFGQITAYNSATGSLTVNVLSYTGSGTLAAWSIGLSVPRGGTETFSGTLYANSFVMSAAASVYWNYDAPGGKVIFNFDANDYLSYDRGVDAFAFMVGGANRLYIDQYGPGRNDDASTPNGLPRKSQVDAQISAQVAALNNRIDIVVPSSVSVLHGQIFHGNTLPLPDGFTEAQCRWLVSPHEYNAGYFDLQEGNAQQAPYFTCKVGAGRVVEAQTRFNIGGWVASWANYIVIGVK